MKKIITFIFLVFILSSCVQNEKYTEGLEYELSELGDSYSVVGKGSSTDVDIIIPNKYIISKLLFILLFLNNDELHRTRKKFQ